MCGGRGASRRKEIQPSSRNNLPRDGGERITWRAEEDDEPRHEANHYHLGEREAESEAPTEEDVVMFLVISSLGRHSSTQFVSPRRDSVSPGASRERSARRWKERGKRGKKEEDREAGDLERGQRAGGESWHRRKEAKNGEEEEEEEDASFCLARPGTNQLSASLTSICFLAPRRHTPCRGY